MALGLLTSNSAGAIVTFLLVPTLFTVLAGFAGQQWLQLASGFGIWAGPPFLLGAARVLRSEVKQH